VPFTTLVVVNVYRIALPSATVDMFAVKLTMVVVSGIVIVFDVAITVPVKPSLRSLTTKDFEPSNAKFDMGKTILAWPPTTWTVPCREFAVKLLANIGISLFYGVI
jgi:hypothetical protein